MCLKNEDEQSITLASPRVDYDDHDEALWCKLYARDQFLHQFIPVRSRQLSTASFVNSRERLLV